MRLRIRRLPINLNVYRMSRPNDLPIVSQDARQFAIGWDTRTCSRLCAASLLLSMKFDIKQPLRHLSVRGARLILG
ncbi:hypothetical protein B0H34DRAFT_150885 [Crassisporium funariophilum]|nr:hypothetical protein B0H34DRAFT_150885 [Crassisporium funariophilum]